MLEVSFLSEIDLFEQLPNSCLEAIEDSSVLDCSAGHLFRQAEQTGRVLFVPMRGSWRAAKNSRLE